MLILLIALMLMPCWAKPKPGKDKTPQEAFKAARYVFLGEVTEVFDDDPGEVGPPGCQSKATVTVKKVFKGNPPATMTLTGKQSGALTRLFAIGDVNLYYLDDAQHAGWYQRVVGGPRIALDLEELGMKL
jgi:hypothetical protein